MKYLIGTRVRVSFEGIVTDSGDWADQVMEVKSEDGHRQEVRINYPGVLIIGVQE